MGERPTVVSRINLYRIQSLEKFYRSPLIPFVIKDEIGYWVVCDPTGSTYFGGYPTGSSPVKNEDHSEDDCYLWRFLDEPDLNIIDLIGGG